MRSSRKFAWLSLFVVLAMVLAACGGAATPAPAAEAPAAEAPAEATEAPAAEAPAEEATEAPAAEAPAAEATEAPAEEPAAEQALVGHITKHLGNPFFVKMEEGAVKGGEEQGLKVLLAAGQFDGDNDAQVTAIENMMAAGVKGIILTANDSTAIVPTVQKARDAGILVIALDTPLNPMDASDALFATDNTKAGELIGAYAKAALGDKEPKIAMLDGTAGTTVSQQRHDGFLKGFGIAEGDAAIVCQGDTNGMIDKAQPVMENCLTANPDINVVYTVNEPAAAGANTALKAAGVDPADVVVVSVDGGCSPGLTGVEDGTIDATSQQYPLLMASKGVEAVANYIKTGEKVSGFVDTGVNLIAKVPVEGVDSKDVAYGMENCWGQ